MPIPYFNDVWKSVLVLVPLRGKPWDFAGVGTAGVLKCFALCLCSCWNHRLKSWNVAGLNTKGLGKIPPLFQKMQVVLKMSRKRSVLQLRPLLCSRWAEGMPLASSSDFQQTGIWLSARYQTCCRSRAEMQPWGWTWSQEALTFPPLHALPPRQIAPGMSKPMRNAEEAHKHLKSFPKGR